MKKSLIPYFAIPCFVLLATASPVHARGDDDDNRGKNKDKKHRKEQHEDRKDDKRDARRGPSISRQSNPVVVRPVIRVEERRDGRRDVRHDDYRDQRIDYRSDRRFDYRDTHRDVSYRTRYPRRVIVYQDRSYGYNYYDMQVVLLREGYYDGPIDGVWGPASRRALVRYQSDQGWRTDDVVDGRFIVNFGIGY